MRQQSRATSAPTIRIRSRDHEMLRALSKQTGEPMQAVLHQALEAYRRRRLLLMTNVIYAGLKEEESTWESEVAERQAWDPTLADGLEDE